LVARKDAAETIDYAGTDNLICEAILRRKWRKFRENNIKSIAK
jgi:hypothetical protein